MSVSYSKPLHSDTPAKMLESNDIYFAYKLGYLSGANIRKEARRPEPRLSKLIGHALLFDCTRKFITEHTILESDNESEDGSTEIEHIEDAEFIEGKAEVVYMEDIDQEATIVDLVTPSKLASKESWSYSQTELCTASIVVSHPCADRQDPTMLPWEDESDSSTEPGDDGVDDDYWSDSTCEEDDAPGHLSTKDYDLCGYSPDLPTYYNQPISKTNDDQVIWSEQPRIMSLRQVEDLFAETFG
ncbi:hypothetical protein PV10_07737 [Exophiala mesophila]|uniref:Uncharacterized protein n=1 Tax=Exophiala mesophila TaxID=212818 RepID=A0A0D1ZUG5_EXOME|nr:uncharacterized protein PV10_07737 [Exophiala mesophila]KIV90428.1 hypothetical protein PV10_07737 [Exophiala mesophila]